MKLRVLDLFAGRGGLSRMFKERGHEVITLDFDAKFGCDLTMDAIAFAEDPVRFLNEAAVRAGFIKEGETWLPGVIVGGPPCEALSVLTIMRHWHPPPSNEPKTDKARLAVRLVQAMLDVVAKVNGARAAVGMSPVWWWMENPRAKLRVLGVVVGLPRVTITACQYGASWQKPTDLWGNFPPSWVPRPTCKPGAACHVSAPRGSKQTGTIQGVGGKDKAAIRAEAPLGLSLSLCLACEVPLPAAPEDAEAAPVARLADQVPLGGASPREETLRTQSTGSRWTSTDQGELRATHIDRKL
jgi:hypothetical protein